MTSGKNQRGCCGLGDGWKTGDRGDLVVLDELMQ